jgi:hypothetical protein
VSLVPRRASKETIEVLTALLAEARAGQVVGLAYVAVHLNGIYTADATGDCKSARTLTLGALLHLQHRILDLL